jgi:hypothetical protein
LDGNTHPPERSEGGGFSTPKTGANSGFSTPKTGANMMKSTVECLWNEMVKSFDIPEMRKEMNRSNVEWFLRNASIKNGDNPLLINAISTARACRWWLVNSK